MLKQTLFCTVFFLTLSLAFSQDIIVTNEGDTIECKITRVTSSNIHFTVFDKSGILLMRSRLPLSTVQYYEQADPAQTEEEPRLAEIEEGDRFILDDYDIPRVRLALNGGFTYQFAGYEDLPSSYRNQVATLWSVGGDLDYFFGENFGVGLKYSHAFTAADEDFQAIDGSIIELRDERIRFNYYALSVMYRRMLYSDQMIHYFLSGGMVKYRTDLEFDGVPVFESADTFGMALGLKYDFRLVENVGVGAGLEVLFATVDELKTNLGQFSGVDFNISRIDLTLGIRFYK